LPQVCGHVTGRQKKIKESASTSDFSHYFLGGRWLDFSFREFGLGLLDPLEQFFAAAVSEARLEYINERLLFFSRQPIGRIDDISKSGHGVNLKENRFATSQL
jgi:hypothetical protein